METGCGVEYSSKNAQSRKQSHEIKPTPRGVSAHGGGPPGIVLHPRHPLLVPICLDLKNDKLPWISMI